MIRLPICIFVFLLFFLTELSAQSVGSLKKKKEQNKKEINYTNLLLKKTLKSKKISVGQLNLLNRNIQLRQNLINTIGDEVAEVNREIIAANKQVISLEKGITEIKQQYAKLLVVAHKQRSAYHKLMFILASQDFNQAYSRFKFLQQVLESVKQQGEIIATKKSSLAKKVAGLKAQRAEKERLLSLKNKEKQRLWTQKQQQSKLVQKLKRKEQQLRANLRKQKRAAQKLEREIQRIIRRTASKKGRKSGRYTLTPAEKKLSKSFGSNKGRLPWPTKTGFISQSFGKHQHAVLKHVNVQNDGIDITTQKGAVCRAVFGGVVSHVLPMSGLNNVVILQHGAYFTVYSNLATVSVKKGDAVTLKQKIGVVFTNRQNNETILKFQLWKGSTKMNPTSWLLRKK